MKQNTKQFLKTAMFSLCTVLFAASAANAANYTVTTTADAGAGSLRQAITDANASAGVDDTINFTIPAASCPSGVCTITLGAALPQIANAGTLTIDNSAGANKINVSGNNAVRVFYVQQNANLTLTAVTVTGGRSSNNGSGIYNFLGGTVTLNNSIVSGNTRQGTSGGGGIFNYGTMTLNNSTVSGNTGSVGGGIYNESIGTLTLNNSTVNGNTGQNSGGIYSNGAVTLNSSTVSGNTGFYSGGFNNNGTLTLNNSTVAFNSSTGSNFACTGICAGGVANNNGKTSNMNNSIAAKNTVADSTSAPDIYGAVAATSSFNLIGDGTLMTGTTNGANNNQIGTSAAPLDPLLAALADNGGQTQTHLLQTGSPAIDKGNSTATTDQRGMTRPVDDSSVVNATGGNGADIGAVEVPVSSYAVDTTSDAMLTACTTAADDCSLRGAITNANASAGVDETISFAIPAANCAGGVCTITLGSTLPSITNAGTFVVDNSAGANKIVLSGNNQFHVFHVESGANLTLTAVTVTGGYSNGGVSNNGTVTLNNSTVSGNMGSGIINRSTLTLNNSTVSGNMATVGGGIYNTGTMTLNNSTFSGNSAAFDGGGIYSNGGTVTLNNTIIANSTRGDCFRNSGTINASYSLIEDNLGCVNGTSSNNLTGDPNLAALADNGGQTLTHALLTGSPAIDKGNSAAATDQRSLARPVDNTSIANATGGNGADIGAVETALAPTAANVVISGRVVTPEGRGLTNAMVYITDVSGATRAARTTTFGRFRFDDIAAGQTVILSVSSKRYQFAPHILGADEDATEIVLQAETETTKQIARSGAKQ